MIGAKTIGNATLIVFDGAPVLATDPWIGGNGAYFGSWQLSHQIPPEEMTAILACRYIFFSHGHPDHLNAESLKLFRDKTILLPDHVGGRIYSDLTAHGFTVEILRDRAWVELSKRVRVCCVSDYFQDAVLLVDINGHLFVDLNDATDRGWGHFVRRVISNFKQSYLLKLSGYGDADMINFFDENGNRIIPEASKRRPVGKQLSYYADLYGVTHVIPFSSLHKYQRADSIWANEYVTPIEAYSQHFNAKHAAFVPAFVTIDCESGEICEINPPLIPDRVHSPEDFGDNWNDLLERDDFAKIEAYFRQKEALKDHFGFINVRVGGTDNNITLNRRKKSGITFEVPRNSLITAIKFEVFDDLLIGNFMKTTLHDVNSLYPHFTPIVAKFADNARAQTKAELRAYKAAYRKRAPVQFLLRVLENESERRFRQFVTGDSLLFNVAARSYVLFKKLY